VFRKCRRLTPSAALLVLALAFLWAAYILWHSDGAARHPHCARELVTGLDATAAPLRNPSSLRANCSYCRSTRLLGCRQKNIQLCRGSSSSCSYCMNLDTLRKVRYRYQQTERGAVVVANSVGSTAARIGLAGWFKAMWVPLTDMLAWMRKPWPDVMLRLLEAFSGAPLVGSIMDRYFARNGSVYSTRPSEQVRGLFERWSIKFSADYYGAKDREEGRKGSH